MLTIWQNHEFTLIGPPLSLGYNTGHQIYFSSLSLYFGLIGLILAKFNPVGAVIPNIVLFVSSIPFFYLFLKKLTHKPDLSLFGTALFAWSPAIVNHARFFWNPNPLIPLSIFFWLSYVFSCEQSLKKYRRLYIFLCGVILGLMFDFHYLGITSGLILGCWMLFKHQYSKLFSYITGFCLGIFPILLFEIRNHAYLTKSLIWNITNHSKIWDLTAPSHPIISLGTPWLSILGLTNTEMSYPLLIYLPITGLIITVLVFLTLQVYRARKLWIQNTTSRKYLLILLITFLFSIVFKVTLHTRYLWGIYPILFWLIAESIYSLKSKLISVLILGFVLSSSLTNVLTARQGRYLVPLTDLALAGNIISEIQPTGAYNISESVTGDAQATALRYFVQRDSVNKPLDQDSYQNLDSLFVLAPSLEDIYAGSRWEFTATPNLELKNYYPVGKNYLYHFVNRASSGPI